MSHFALVPVSEIGFPLFGVSRSDLLRLLVAPAVPPSAYAGSCCASPDGGSVSGGGRAFSSYAVRLSEAAKATLCLFSRRKSIYAVLGNSSSVSQTMPLLYLATAVRSGEHSPEMLWLWVPVIEVDELFRCYLVH